MNIYDALDTLGSVNEDVRVIAVSVLASDTQMVQAIKSHDHKETLKEVFLDKLELEEVLTEMEFSDLEERLS